MALTVKDVEREVEEIRALATKDDEAAHSREDALHARVLGAIARGNPAARELAQAAVASKRIDFVRWTA
jgi:hypothetical protein